MIIRNSNAKAVLDLVIGTECNSAAGGERDNTLRNLFVFLKQYYFANASAILSNYKNCTQNQVYQCIQKVLGADL